MTDEQKVQLLPCPWCGSLKIEIRGRCLECCACGSIGPELPLGGTARDMDKLWNTRQAALSHASATAEECSVVGEAVAWLEVEPGVSFERAVSEHGMLIHSMQVHVGRRKPTKHQDGNGLFPLFGHPPRSAEDARDAERLRFLADEQCTLRVVDVPIPLSGDADTIWEVVDYYMAEPKERIIGTGATPAQAIDQAIAGKRGGK